MTRELLAAIQRLLRPLTTRVANMVARAVVSQVDDSTRMQLLKLDLLDTETRDELERFQNYGFTSVPAAPDSDGAAEAAVVFVDGRRDHGLVVAVDDRRYRVKGLNPGEVAIYDKTGSKVLIKANGDIELAPSSGNVHVTGTLTASVDVVGGGKHLATHTHNAGSALLDSGVSGGTVTGTTAGPN